jgi:hypothetical protein
MVNKAWERTMVDDRIAALEARTKTLEARMLRLEAARPARERAAMTGWARPEMPRIAAEASEPARSVAPPGYGAAPVPRPVAPKREAVGVEDFLGGRVLAWLGGVAVIFGLGFLLALAASRGWIGEGARTALAGAISAALLIGGARLRERRVRNDAALAAAAAGVAGLFGTLVAAGQVYDLIPTALALLGALVTGAVATALAVRWRAQVMGWLGLAGALLAPAVLGGVAAGSIAFLAVAYGATVAVLTWQRWTALGFAAFALAAPQWLFWSFSDHRSTPAILLTLVVFGALTTAAAVGFELRRRESAVRIAAVVLLVLDAVAIDGAGASLLHPAWLWLAGVAAVHLAVGLGGTRIPRVSRELSLVALGLGVILADVAFASFASGLPLVLGWSASAVGFGALLRHASSQGDRAFALAGLGGHLLSALVHSLLIDAPSSQLAGGHPGPGAILAIAIVGASAAVSGRLADRFRIPLDTLALAALAYATALTLDGLALTAALAAEAGALAAIARRERDALAAHGGLAFAGLALTHALATAAPPSALIDGLDRPLIALGAVLAAAAALLAASRAPFADPRIRPALGGLAAVAALHLASTQLVTHAGAAGQTALSVLWASAGVATLITGLVADRARLREAALALLALTAGKVFVYDLSSLDSMARVGSLVGLGVLLLAGGYAWQRVRPLGLPDLREVGEAPLR